MAEDEEQPQFTTLAERIAALNKQKNFQAPASTSGKRPPPPPPTAPVRTATESAVSTISAPKNPAIPPRPTRAATEDPTSAVPPLPRRKTEDVSPTNGKRGLAPPPTPSRGAPPPLPSRNSQKRMTPAPELPSRRPSAQTLPGRRGSASSDASHLSGMSSLSLNTNGASDSHAGGRRLPPTLDQAKLPPLPPSRRETEAAKKAAEEESSARSPALPPRLPSRPGKSPSTPQPDEEPSPALPARRLPPPPSSYRPNGFNTNRTPSSHDVKPPPVPLTSRPTFEQISAIRNSHSLPSPSPSPSPNPNPTSQPSCLICRDYSAPDSAAALYPICNLPRSDPVGYLAHMLCDPFPSPTDKARAIFTWCHHNIAYDTDSFFNNCVRNWTAEESIFSGKAVCGGYATIYEAIATRAGLECVMVTGHGKGYGYTAPTPGQPLPPRKPDGHAWNAVRIDGGRWKLVDPCWGAGNVGDRTYHKVFSPLHFTASNEIFGKRHFPKDPAHFFRDDGRVLSWEEYIIGDTPDGEPAMVYESAKEEGLNEFGFSPRQKHISVYRGEPVVQFRFSKVCEHWTPERNGKGKPMLFALKINGLDGRKEDTVMLDFDGLWFAVDVPRRELGCPGQKISLFGIDTIGGRDARGLTREEWLRKKGRVGCSWVGLAEWELI